MIPRGSYTLFTLPSRTQWKMIINKQTGQWGTEYDPRQDFARINIENKQLNAPVEKLTFTLEQRTDSTGRLRIEWEKTSLLIPITLKSN